MGNVSLVLMAILTIVILYALSKWLKKETVFSFSLKKEDLKLELITEAEYIKNEKHFNYFLLATFGVVVIVSIALKHYYFILEFLILLLPLFFSLFGSKKRTIKNYRLHLPIEGKDSVVSVYDHWLNEIPDNSLVDIEVGKSAIDGSLSIRKFRAKVA